MITSLQNADFENYLDSLSPTDIVYSLSLNDIKRFLESLGVEQIEVNEEKEYIVCPTICHNPLHEAESMKLYWYHNYKIFRCYTECNEAMSIFELYRRYMALNQYEIDFNEAIAYVKNFILKTNVIASSKISQEEIDLNAYKYDTYIPQQKEYSSNILDCGIKFYHPAC